MSDYYDSSSAEVQHASRAHARLNASSSHRWMMCPPSVKLSEQFADRPSPYAEEGTYLHELCELKLHRYLGDMASEAIEAQYTEHRDSDFYSNEAESVTEEYVAFCTETIEAVKASCADPLIMVEHRLDYSEYVPEGYGTGDLVIIGDGIIKVARLSSKCNTPKHLEGRKPTETFSWAMIDGVNSLLQISVRQGMEVEAFTEEQADDVIGILVGATLPGFMGFGEENRCLENLLHPFEFGEFRAVVKRNALNREIFEE